MKKFILCCSCLFLVFTGSNFLFGSHYKGAYFEYECLSACTVRVKHFYYRDCSGTFYTGPGAVVVEGIGTGCAGAIGLGNWNAQTVIEVTPVCPTVATNCAAAMNPFRGIEMWGYWRDYDVCSTNCSTIQISWGHCCRNGTIVSGAGNQSSWLSTAFNLVPGCNSSPVYNFMPYMYICSGEVNTVSLGGVDPDGDSLAYQLVPCYQTATTLVTYNPGYTPQQFMGTDWDITLNEGTGDLLFVPQPGNPAVGIACILVEEWRNGVLIASGTREVEFTSVVCGNNTPPTFLPLTNISGAVTGGADTLFAYPGTQLQFDLPTLDPDAGQTQSLHFDPTLNGALFTNTSGNLVNPIVGNNPVGRFAFTPPTVGTYHARFFIKDDMCPIYGYFTRTLTIIATNAAPPLSGIAMATSTGCNQVQMTSAGVGGTPPYTYAWSGGGGLNTNPNNTDSVFSHTYQNAGTYPVQLVITDAALDTWTWNDTLTVNNYVQGFVQTSSGGALQNQQLLLVHYNPMDSSLTSIDTAFSDNVGYFEFCTPDTLVYIKATPDSATYPTEMPTYADTALAWQNARAYNLNGSGSNVVIFATKFGQNPGGPGFIGGLIINGANKRTDPVTDLELFLMGPGGYPYGRIFTDQDGYFSFPDIPHGDYEIWVNKPFIDNSYAPKITLTALMETQDSLLFTLKADRLEMEVTTGISIVEDKVGVEIVPNPFQDQFELEVMLPHAAVLSYEIQDAQGKRLGGQTLGAQPAGAYRKMFQDPGLPKGIYFLRIQLGEEIIVRKLLKL